MFESANLDHRLDKQTFEREERKLREALLLAQYDLKENGLYSVPMNAAIFQRESILGCF